MKQRPATPDEIVHGLRHYRKDRPYPCRLRYEHYTRELNNPRAVNGVSHRRYSNSYVYVIDGIAHVRYQGKFEPLQATLCTLDNGKTIVASPTIIKRS